MAQPFRFASIVSGAVLASMLAGCAVSHDQVETASGLGGKTGDDVGLATRAMVALNSSDVDNAVRLAERAVEKTPDDAGFRTILGNAYFAAGRFASAESAYRDALTIYANQPQTVLKLALAQIAQGKNAAAAATLDAGKTVLDPANYGLALALAGRAGEAVAVLEARAREPGADSRIRQNLALAMAMTGDWTNARIVAAQDLPANQVDARVQQWMQFAKPAHASDQIAALTGIKPAASDPGEPVRLALSKPDTRLAEVAAPAVAAEEPVAQQPTEIAEAVPQPPAPQEQADAAAPAPRFAEAVPVAQPQAVPPAPPPADPARVAAVDPRPVVAEVAQAAAAAPEAPAAFAAFAPRFAPKPMVKAAAPRAKRPAVRVAAVRRGNGGAVVQLGAYRSPDYVSAAWSQLTRRYPALRAYLPLRARFDSPQGTFWRLSIQGFASQREAIARCNLLKSRGGNCFVRGFAGDAPVQIASR